VGGAEAGTAGWLLGALVDRTFRKIDDGGAQRKDLRGIGAFKIQ